MLRGHDDAAACGGDAAGDVVRAVRAVGHKAEEARGGGGEGAAHDLAHRDHGGSGVRQPAVHTGVHCMTCETMT